MPTDDDDEIIIIRRAARSAKVTEAEREYLFEIAAALKDSRSIHWLDRIRVRRLLSRVVFG